MTELTDFLDTEYGLQRGESAWRESAVSAGEQLVADLELAPEELRRQLLTDRGMRLVAVREWLNLARKDGDVLPGEAMANGFKLVGGFATVGGIIFGIGAGRAALSSPSEEPVNLWLCLGMLVLVQVVLLLGAVILATVAKSRGRQWFGAFTNLLKWLHRWSWARKVSASEMLQALPRTQRVERWTWLGLTQRFAVAFNFGALLIFVEMLLFSELQFGWATTPDSIEISHMQGLVDALAAPWGWAFPESWVPNENVIAATQWDALAGKFRSPNADGRVWWPFVMMNLMIWGLIPRLVLMQWCSNGQRRELQRLDWNHRRLQELFDVMLPVLSTSSAAHEDPAARAETKSFSPPQPNDGLAIVAWGDWDNAMQLQAGGRDLHADAQLVARLARENPESVQVVVEAGEAPDKRFISFIVSLRGELGRERLIHVCPIEVNGSDPSKWEAPQDRDTFIWRRTLASLHDDHLFVSAATAIPDGSDRDGS